MEVVVMWPPAFIAQRLRQEWKGEDWMWDLTWSSLVEEGTHRLPFLEGARGRRWKGREVANLWGWGISGREQMRECWAFLTSLPKVDLVF
jgi:hypothetical protein